MKVFVTGGTGFIGRALVQALGVRGDQAVVVTRRPEAVERALGGRIIPVPGDPAAPGPWMERLDGCDAVVGLAGEPIFGKRWSEPQKRAIRESRVRSTGNLVRAIAAARVRPRVFVCGSAIGYYGPRGEEELDEDGSRGSDFLAGVCEDWEAAAKPAADLGVRVVRLRIGVVLGEGGGALEKMMTPFKLFAGGPVGDGRQWFSWVHREDVVGLILFAMQDERLRGAVNAVGPAPMTMAEFCRTLGRVLGRPSWLPAPGFALRLALGEVADVLLTGQRVLPRAALGAGYPFKYRTAEEALRAILS